jgi:hypothetical protein
MRQKTMTDGRFGRFREETCKAQLSEEMEQIIPWQELTELIELECGRPEAANSDLLGMERMLRIGSI